MDFWEDFPHRLSPGRGEWRTLPAKACLRGKSWHRGPLHHLAGEVWGSRLLPIPAPQGPPRPPAAYRGSEGRTRLPPQDAQHRGLRGGCQELQQPQLGPRLGEGYRGHHAGRGQDLAQTSGQRRGVPGRGRDGHQFQTQVVRQPRRGDGQGGQDAGAGGGRAGQERSQSHGAAGAPGTRGNPAGLGVTARHPGPQRQRQAEPQRTHTLHPEVAAVLGEEGTPGTARSRPSCGSRRPLKEELGSCPGLLWLAGHGWVMPLTAQTGTPRAVSTSSKLCTLEETEAGTSGGNL